MRIASATVLFVLALTFGCARQPMVPTTVPCPGLAVAGPLLIYPAPGATGVPVAAGDLVLAGLPIGTDVHAQLDAIPSNGATPIALGAFTTAPSPLPTPTATGSPDATLYGVAHPILSAHTTYAVDYASSNAAPCPQIPRTSASFTTARTGSLEIRA